MSLLAARLAPDSVVCQIPAVSRKRVLQTIAETIAAKNEQTTSVALFDELLARERLGSTGIGEGVAIPHCRHNVSDIEVCLLTTSTLIDYDAIDGEHVDIFFALIVPTHEHRAHLRALADLSTILAEPSNRACLRACDSAESLYSHMHNLLGDIVS